MQRVGIYAYFQPKRKSALFSIVDADLAMNLQSSSVKENIEVSERTLRCKCFAYI